MTTIRGATLADLPKIVELRRESYEHGSFSEWAGDFDSEHFYGVFSHALTEPASKLCWLLVAENEGEVVGTSFGILVPVWMKPQMFCASEVFIWVSTKARCKGVGNLLIGAVEEWAKSHGASFVSMFSYPKLDQEAMKHVCTKRGYVEIETNHIKRIA